MSDPEQLAGSPAHPLFEPSREEFLSGGALRRLRVGGLILLIGAAYVPALRGEFLASDYTWLVRSRLLTSDDALRRIWIDPETDQYQPLTYTFFWIERHPDSWAAHFQLGEYLLRREKAGPEGTRRDLERAGAHFEAAGAVNPTFGTTWVNLGAVKAALGRREEAIADLRRAIAVEPDQPLGYEALGNLLMERREITAAIENFQHLVRLQPKRGMAHYRLGFALCAGDRLEEGVHTLREALRLGLEPSARDRAVQMLRVGEQELSRRTNAAQPSRP
ncbi:MAG: tetratricopeptide repeat protein [Planctomycetota bacterium]